MNVSVADLKKNYNVLNVDFDLWKGEADVQKYIPDMVHMLKEKGFAHYDEGALVVDVAEEDDNKAVPPCMILKSDGAALCMIRRILRLWWSGKACISPTRSFM